MVDYSSHPDKPKHNTFSCVPFGLRHLRWRCRTPAPMALFLAAKHTLPHHSPLGQFSSNHPQFHCFYNSWNTLACLIREFHKLLYTDCPLNRSRSIAPVFHSLTHCQTLLKTQRRAACPRVIQNSDPLAQQEHHCQGNLTSCTQ